MVLAYTIPEDEEQRKALYVNLMESVDRYMMGALFASDIDGDPLPSGQSAPPGTLVTLHLTTFLHRELEAEYVTVQSKGVQA